MLSLFLFILCFRSPILQFWRKTKCIQIYALSDLCMRDFWPYKNIWYFSMIPVYENIKLFNNFTFLLVSILLNQIKCGKRYFFYLLIIRSEIFNIFIFQINNKQCRKNTRHNYLFVDFFSKMENIKKLRTPIQGIIIITLFL